MILQRMHTHVFPKPNEKLPNIVRHKKELYTKRSYLDAVENSHEIILRDVKIKRVDTRTEW